jgi:arylsulfatase A-like enzyme
MSSRHGGRPNVVLINCDDLGYGDLGCYGSTRNATPALDRMAAEGLRFDAFYMASPVCSPSRAALLTGCYPPRIGFGSFDGLPVLFPGQAIGLPPSEISLARLLAGAGYRTQMVGKWHCGDQPDFLPTNHGFEHWFGIPYSNDMGRQVIEPDATWRPDFPPLPLVADRDVVEQQPDQAPLTERFVAEAVRFLRAHRDEPFFLYLAHIYVHLPIYVQDRFARGSANGAYGAAVECIDWATDVILAELRSLGLDDDTLVVFTSDNGSRARDEGGSNAPLRGTKATTWEGGMRVPGIARWPGRIAPGHTTSELATAMDLYPTLARLCGAELPTDRTIDGRDITGLLFDPAAVSPHEVFLYYFMEDLEAIRDRRWKLHVARRGAAVNELYDLVADPGETTDVAPAHPEVVRALEVHAEEARRSLGDALLGITGSDVRPAGRVADPAPLTAFDPDHPYDAAEYDLPDRG